MKKIVILSLLCFTFSVLMALPAKSDGNKTPTYSQLINGLSIYKLDNRIKEGNYNFKYVDFNNLISGIKQKTIVGKVAVLMRIYDEGQPTPQSMAELTPTGFRFMNLYLSNQEIPSALTRKYISIYNILLPVKNIGHTQVGNYGKESIYSFKCPKNKAEEIINNKNNLYLLLIMSPGPSIDYDEVKGTTIFHIANLSGMYIVNLNEDKLILDLNSCVRKMVQNEKRQVINVLDQEYLKEKKQLNKKKTPEPQYRTKCKECRGTGRGIGDWSCPACGGKGYINRYY